VEEKPCDPSLFLFYNCMCSTLCHTAAIGHGDLVVSGSHAAQPVIGCPTQPRQWLGWASHSAQPVSVLGAPLSAGSAGLDSEGSGTDKGRLRTQYSSGLTACAGVRVDTHMVCASVCMPLCLAVPNLARPSHFGFLFARLICFESAWLPALLARRRFYLPM
jgi:hypothetical protein